MAESQKDLVPVFIPALGAVLLGAEDKKGSPLDEKEVTAIRDKSTVMMMEVDDAQNMDKSRGYKDVDPENCWHDFQKLRDKLGRKPSVDPGPRFDKVRDSDAEFKQTVIRARATLNVFKELIQMASRKDGVTLMIKTRIVDDGNGAFMWLNEAREAGDGFSGVLFEVPASFKEHRVGEKISVKRDCIMDWMVNDNGLVHGGYSIRLLRAREPENERARFDSYMGVKSYEPLPAEA